MTDATAAAETRISHSLDQHAEVVAATREALIPAIARLGLTVRAALAAGNKVMLCGNGGSAADAQHISAELIGRFKKERGPLGAIALTTDSSILTCVGNDYSFDDIFSRQVLGLGRPGDVLIGISTSGNSANVINAMAAAEQRQCVTVALVGRDGGKLAPLAQQAIIVPSNDTARIQEMHIMIGHMMCDFLED
ncbi:MAG TPA: D-sedoheptulose 7-phosphate isomerase [Thiobacillus sp.]|nr:D-sedoheptulose 7-phosphate isomerase [Thiobacillus sp.]